ncbi:MAG: DNA-processing protein DprA [Desulfobacteraceae bacterium]|nr:DNA-processing protein DprA [Desulfobacteraceae bacterium]
MTLALENWQQKGIWVISRADADYPDRLKRHFRDAAPPILYGVGAHALLAGGGLAMVGSRKVDEEGVNFTRNAAVKCAREHIQIVSGGARGVDEAAMMAGLEAGGKAIGVLSSKLEQAAVARKYRTSLMNSHLVLISPFSPHAGFNVGAAMGRNKYIYALSDWALAVDATEGKGGTWGGATENLKHGWVPMFVYKSENIPSGNQQLIRRGAFPMDNQVLDDAFVLGSWLKKTRLTSPKMTQGNLPGMK